MTYEEVLKNVPEEQREAILNGMREKRAIVREQAAKMAAENPKTLEVESDMMQRMYILRNSIDGVTAKFKNIIKKAEGLKMDDVSLLFSKRLEGVNMIADATDKNIELIVRLKDDWVSKWELFLKTEMLTRTVLDYNRMADIQIEKMEHESAE